MARLRQLSAPTLPPRPNPQDGRMNDTLQSEACTRQDLKFNFGQGVEVRAEINNLGVPTAIAKDMPPMYQDDEDDGPVYATPWETMGGNQPAMEAKDFLPEGLCEMGLCDTMLPGCRQAQFKKLFFPRLVFNYSKEFDYDLNSTNSTTQKMLQEAMAWAFSAMPEAIEVALQELQQREQELKKQTAVPNYGFGNYGNQNQNQNQFGFGNPSQQQNNWFNQPQQNSGLGNTQQMPQAFGKWWNTQRRLSDKRMGVDQDGNLVEMPRKLMSHQVEIQFRDGLPYNVDHVLIKKMVKQGMLNVDRHNLFKKDKPEIVGFYLEDLGSITIPNQPESRTVFAGAAACAALAAAAVAGVLLSLRKRPASEGYEASLSSQGLE
ncbi:unnamed protein product [Effrenium voratum]|nr:unnamed protein product [Effrenium voratum]